MALHESRLLLLSILILQGIASFSRAMTSTLSGHFAARCQAEVVPKVHRFILSFHLRGGRLRFDTLGLSLNLLAENLARIVELGTHGALLAAPGR